MSKIRLFNNAINTVHFSVCNSRTRNLLKHKMKLILFILLCTVIPVRSGITSLNKRELIKAGDSAKFSCDKPEAGWQLGSNIIANCTKCPSSSCDVKEPFKGRVTASCDRTKSILHFKSTEISDKGSLRCRSDESSTFTFLIGNYDVHLRPENNKYKFAIKNEDYALICDKEKDADMTWYNQTGDPLSYFRKDCRNLIPNNNKEKFTITCNQNEQKGRLVIKSVTLKDDGQIFGCDSAGKLYLYKLTVNVAVTSVSIKQQTTNLIENKKGIFICTATKSKPAASFEWITVDQKGKEETQTNFNETKTRNNDDNKPHETTSYLNLQMKRSYREIKCRARIENMPWESDSHQLSDIKYRPDGEPKMIVPKSGMCVGKETEIKCEWKGGNPDATLKLKCVSIVKEGENSVSIQKFMPQKVNTTCTCHGKHIGGNARTRKMLDIHYPPEKVNIKQTLYLEGNTTPLICEATGGNPAVYNYSWSPGNHPHEETIQLKLKKEDNKKKFTCKVYHECSGDNPVSETRELNVEYPPVIKMSNTMTVIENQIREIDCKAEGNPTPTIKWKIGNKNIEEKILRVPFTRNNTSKVECIASANSTQDGLLKTSKIVSINVTYPPDIISLSKDVTKLEQKAQISCRAEANPNKIKYTLVQKWGETVKRKFETSKGEFSKLTYEDFGTWECQASNGVPNEDHYTEKHVEIKVDVSAHFKGQANETATVGSTKELKICFYCNPKATEVKWYKGDEEMPSDRIIYISAEDGAFPFTGNCSILKVNLKNKETKIYSLRVTNPVGTEIFRMTLDAEHPDEKKTYIIIICVIAAFILSGLIGGVWFFRNRRSKNKTQSKNNRVNSTQSPRGEEQTQSSIYANIYDVPRNLGVVSEYEHPVSQSAGDESEYVNMVSRSADATYENQTFYENVPNKPIKTDMTYENQTFYENTTNRPIRTGRLNYEESRT